MSDIVEEFFPEKKPGTTMAGQCDLILLSDLIGVKLSTLQRMSTRSDFPAYSILLSGVRLYDVSRVARYMQVPVRRRK